jgi:hypothetical protein
LWQSILHDLDFNNRDASQVKPDIYPETMLQKQSQRNQKGRQDAGGPRKSSSCVAGNLDCEIRGGVTTKL